MIAALRLVRAQFQTQVWSGEGGLYVDGRWHRPGRRIIYTAQSLSLAQLEVLVHICDRRQMPELVHARALIPEVLVETIENSSLPKDWRRFSPYSPVTQHVGMQWLEEARSAVLKVPSAVSEAEWNFLLNPVHPDFPKVHLGEPAAFLMDPRLH